MKITLIITLFLLFICPLLHANIGSNKNALIGKYGEPVSKGLGNLTFKKDGMTIKAYFIGQICERIDYSMNSSTQSAVKKILKGHGTFTMDSFDEKNSAAIYKDSKTKHKATWYTKKKLLSIYSPKMDK